MSFSYSTQRILVVAPHADDEAIGCGGLISKTSTAGGTIHVAIGSQRSLDRKWRDGHYDEYPRTHRERELTAAAEVLGFDFSFLVQEDALHRLDTIPQENLIAAIEQQLLLRDSTLLLLPTPTYDQDHCALFTAGIAAARPHYWSGDTLLYVTVPLGQTPNVFVDISEVLERKVDACRAYATQQTDHRSWVSPESVKLVAQFFGRAIGIDAAEAYIGLRVRW